MNSIGNDNYRPGLTPPEPVRQNTGWLSSNMAQLMVFLNGLILTITAFATLNVFINEIVREELLETTQEVQEFIASEFAQAEKSLNAFATVLGQSENQSVEDYIQLEAEGSGYFNALYVVDNGQAKSIEQFFMMEEFRPTDTTFVSMLRQQNFSQKALAAGDVVLMPLAPSAVRDTLNEFVPFALVKKINGSNQSFVAAIFTFDSFIQQEWIGANALVENIRLTNAESGEPLFFYKKNVDEANDLSKYTDAATITMAGQTVSMEVGLNIGTREAFLQKIPLLMLMFGVTLTLIGTLYVRNNQAQSRKLALMNKELAHKNFELNQQIREGERLNDVIRKSAKEHQSIINSVSDIIFELSEDGKILFLNEAWNKVTGFEHDRSIGRSLFDLIYIQDQDEMRKAFDDLIKGHKQEYRMFTRLRSADGHFRAIELALSMVRQSEDKELHLVGTITDVEERRRAERALSEAEKKYRAIVENAAGGIYQVTPEGQFLSANPAFARILGYESAEIVLRDVEDAKEQIYMDADTREAFLQDISKLNISKSHEIQVRKKDGSVIWVSENVRPVFDDENNLLYFEGSMEDVDQRKKAELALKVAKTESDLANRSKSEFLANMSHELRTPLNAIIGFSDIIRSESFGKIEQMEYKDYASNIYESGNRLLRVINEILDVSRIEAGERALNESVINIHKTVKSSLDLLERKIRAGSIRVENKIKDNGVGLIGESQALKQMLINLVSNAVKFSPPNSMLMIDAEIDGQDRLRLSVTDTGIGMSDSELEKALEPFGQIDTEHSRNKSGTGLGLTLVKSLVELHGGELEMVSQKGIGTTATLIFPAKRVTNKGGSAQAEKQSYEGVAPRETQDI
jgi:PAS domain S-box-containing protein